MITFIVPTIGRASLLQTLASIETWPGDEILVVGTIGPIGDPRPRYIPCPTGGDGGSTERTLGMSLARTPYLAFLDDDDMYAPGHRPLMESATQATPGRPVLFRMRYPNGLTLWREPAILCGNVGTPMILIPNVPAKLGTWSSRYASDFDFLATMRWPPADVVWRREVIARVGHDV